MGKTEVALILAGGRGKRMDILCYLRPKPALPFAGRFRVIDFSLSNCVHSQIGAVGVLVDYQRANMTNYINRWHSANGSVGELSVLPPKVGSYIGTADAVYQTLAYLNEHDADTVLILAGDHVYKMNYRRMVAFHRMMKADVTVGVVRVPVEEAHRFGTLAVDAEARITDFVEKSATSSYTLASMGIYVFDKKFLAERLFEDANNANSSHDFGYAILPRIVKRDRVFAYAFDGYWQDIGTVKAYYEANMELLGTQPRFSLNSNWPILTESTHPLAGLKSALGAIGNSLISPGCVIKGRVENSILSPGVYVGEKAEVRNSVIMGNVSIGYHSIVDRCILDEGVEVGQSCYIGIGSSLLPGNWEITVLGKDAKVPSHTAISRNCRILPRVGPGDFTKSVVPSNNVLSPRL
jgi:glucose-1-phosphate adenylyltransferase